MNIRERLAMIKDMILFFGGLTGIAYQQITGDVNLVLLGIFTAMTGVPGLMNLVALLRSPPIGSPSSSSVSEQQELESDNS